MDVSEILAQLQTQIRAKQYRLSIHAETEREADQILNTEIVEAILSAQAEIIENYPSDPRGASCLVLGFTKKSKPIHVVCGLAYELVIVITVYRPDPQEWIDWHKRKEVDE